MGGAHVAGVVAADAVGEVDERGADVRSVQEEDLAGVGDGRVHAGDADILVEESPGWGAGLNGDRRWCRERRLRFDGWERR